MNVQVFLHIKRLAMVSVVSVLALSSGVLIKPIISRWT